MKTLKEFPELINKLHNLKVQHFQEGLDPNLVLNKDDDLYYGATQIMMHDENTFFEDKHILHFLIEQNHGYEWGKDLYEFAKKSLVSLKGTIEQKYIDRIAALSISVQSGNEVLDLLAENGMLDINAKPDGFCLLMFTKQKNKINRLIELGCDINQKVDNTESKNYGKTVYEVALAAKKKGWVDYLKPHLNQAVLDNSSNEELVDFQNAKKSSEQLKLYLKSIKQKNYPILDEIIANQIKYKDLIEYYDGNGKNLIFMAIGHNSNDVLEKLVNIEYYQKNKSAKNKHGDCYTTNAISLNKKVAAKFLYSQGFFDYTAMINLLELGRNQPMPELIELMGDSASLTCRILNFADKNLDTLKTPTKDELKHFFDSNQFLFNFDKIVSNKMASDKNQADIKDFNPDFDFPYINVKEDTWYVKHLSYQEIRGATFNILSYCLAQQKSLDFDSFEVNINKVLGALGKNEERIAKMFSVLVLKQLPQEQVNILDYLSYYGRPKWISEETYEKLNASLEFKNTSAKKVKL